MQPLEVAQRESVIALEIIIISAVEICIREIKKVFFAKRNIKMN